MTVPAVFDTVVLGQAAGSPAGPAGHGLSLVSAGVVKLFANADGLAEVEDVLNRVKVRRQFPYLTDDRVAAFLAMLRATVTVVAAVPTVYRLPRDPKDEHVINLAVASGARFLVTRDNDLLDLMRTDTADGKAFVDQFPGLIILGPVAFLAAMAPAP